MSHTPGPWLYSMEGSFRAYVVDEEGYTIFAMHANPNTTQVAPLAANAQLVVNAPRLLDALRQISLCSVNSASSREEMGRIAREAIARAEGKA